MAGDKAAIKCISLGSSVRRSIPGEVGLLASGAGQRVRSGVALTASGLSYVTTRAIGWLDAVAIPATEAAWGNLHASAGELSARYAVGKRFRLMTAKALRTMDITGRTGTAMKRALDVSASATAIVLLLPAFAVVYVLIRRTMGGPVIYAHPRVGKGGQIFNCYKFRSMVQNSEHVLERHLAGNPHAQREWSATRKLRNDPRVTPLGGFLRRTSIDELPQLLNVLRGDMSLVGPRPIVASELELYKPYTAEYIAMKPGITGLWQVSGRSNTSYARRVELDRFYARRWSLGLDLNILFRTIPALVRTNEAV